MLAVATDDDWQDYAQDVVVKAIVGHLSGVALSSRWCELWREGAIFPREMVYFLAECERNLVSHIVECGRQDGCSTRMLAAARPTVETHSIDYAQPLPGMPRVLQHSGDAFELLPKLIHSLPRTARIALLVDGPKDASGLALVAALLLDRRIVVVAFHNRAKGDLLHEVLGQRGLFYEERYTGFDLGAAWQALGRAEQRLKAVRSLTQSSLALFVPSRRLRWRLAHLVHPAFHLYQPPALRAAWRLFGYRLPRHLFLLSFKLWGS